MQCVSTLCQRTHLLLRRQILGFVGRLGQRLVDLLQIELDVAAMRAEIEVAGAVGEPSPHVIAVCVSEPRAGLDDT